MAQKKKAPEKKIGDLGDVIISYNQDTQECRVVSGVDKEGMLKSVEPSPDNESHYMKVDKNASMFTNFWKNFVESVKSPLLHLKFYKSDKKQVKENVKAIREALQNRTPEGDKILKVLSELTQLVNKEKEAMAEKQKKEPYINLDKVKWDELAQVGLTREAIEKEEQTERLETGKRSNRLFHLYGSMNGINVDDNFVIQFFKKQDGTIGVKADGVAKQFPEFVMGTGLTKEQVREIITTGRLEGTINIKMGDTNIVREAYLTYDPIVNKAIPLFKSPHHVVWDEMNGHKVTDDEKKRISAGLSVAMPDMRPREGGNPFGAYVYFDALEQGIKVDIKRFFQEQSEDVRKICHAKQINGTPISAESLDKLNNKEYIYLENMTYRNGRKVEPYSSWVGWKKNEKGRYGYDFQKYNPSEKQKQKNGQNQNKRGQGNTAKPARKVITSSRKTGVPM